MTPRREVRVLAVMPLPMLLSDAVALLEDCTRREPTAVVDLKDDGTVCIVVKPTRRSVAPPAGQPSLGDT